MKETYLILHYEGVKEPKWVSLDTLDNFIFDHLYHRARFLWRDDKPYNEYGDTGEFIIAIDGNTVVDTHTVNILKSMIGKTYNTISSLSYYEMKELTKEFNEY